MKDVGKVMFPVMWVDETVTIDDKNADLYKSMATIPLLLLNIFALGFGLGLGCLVIIVSMGLLIYHRNKKHKELEMEKIKLLCFFQNIQ